jgi:hypothetical protein
MKRLVTLASIAIFIVIGTVLLWRIDVVAVIVHRNQFDGGNIGFTSGSSAIVEAGSGTSIVFLKIRDASTIVLSCHANGKPYSDEYGYIEPGPIQIMVVSVERCKFGSVGTPRNIVRFVIDFPTFR